MKPGQLKSQRRHTLLAHSREALLQELGDRPSAKAPVVLTPGSNLVKRRCRTWYVIV